MANKIYGLIGFPLGHSFSKSYFNNKFCNELDVCVADEDKRFVSGVCVAQLAAQYKKSEMPAEKIMPVYLRLPQAQRELNNRKGLKKHQCTSAVSA